MTFRSTAKRLVIGTALESPIKRLHYRLTRSMNSLYDVQTIEIMRRVLRQDSIGVDVGAFEGGMLNHIARFAPQGTHFAFEPIPELCSALKARFPTYRIYQNALGDRVGTTTFCQVTDQPALSGLRRRADLLAGVPVREIEVAVETLDRLVPTTTDIAFVKIDVEGGELGVFRGGRETLRRCRPVTVFECGLGAADSYDLDPSQLFQIITDEIGLRVYLLGAWLQDTPPLASRDFADQYSKGLNFYFVAAP